MLQYVLVIAGVVIVMVVFGLLIFSIRCYQRGEQSKALIRTGWRGTQVSFDGIVVLPIIQRSEVMDISVKRVEIERSGKDGLVCKDNLRADIRVSFFVRVNKTPQDVLKVAQSLGCARTSDHHALVELFESKFSEALKTVGKQFDFTELYTSRDRFKAEILQTIGTDLNGYGLDDAAIDYLEQTSMEFLSAGNILDAEGIKKITELTAAQRILSNKIEREKEKTITQQDVEAREAILELQRQLAEKEEQQKREVASVRAREFAETAKIQHEERLKAERARILADEEIKVADENKNRAIIAATKNKERTEAVETERVERDRLLEVNERERIVTLANIEKERAVEEERKNIQTVIRDRVIVEKAVVEEEERIKDTRAKAGAEREKSVAITKAEEKAEMQLVASVKAADSERMAAEHRAKQQLVEAEAQQLASEKKATAMKTLAEAKAAEEAIVGMSEVSVQEAKARAIEKQGAAEANVLERKAQAEAKSIEMKAAATEKEGTAQANVLERKATAEAKGTEAKAEALQKQGVAEASVLAKKLQAEADGIKQKADAMRALDGVGKEHEEFKIRMDVERQLELARINIQKDVAHAQALVIAEALKAAKIDIVGGETMFFEKIIGSVMQAKAIDRFVENSTVAGDVKEAVVGDGGFGPAAKKIRELVKQFGITSDDVRNLTLSALVVRLIAMSESRDEKGLLRTMLEKLQKAGFAEKPATIIDRA